MISVVIPLYNKQNSIVATLQSVFAQTYTDYEVIVVDDGSTDDSANVAETTLREFCENHSNYNLEFKVVRKKNGGVSSARNEGIRQSKYDYVAFLDADDYWEPKYLETQQALIRDFPEAKMWGTAWGLMNGNNKQEGHGVRIAEEYRGVLDATTYFSNKMYLYWTSIVIVDKRIFEQIEMFDERLSCGEDVDLWWRIILHYPVAYVNKCMAYYKQDTENRLMLSSPKLQSHFVYYIEKYDEYYEMCHAFICYLQTEALGHLYKYFLADPDNTDIKRILNHVDFSLLPFSYKLRYSYPKLYKILSALRNRK